MFYTKKAQKTPPINLWAKHAEPKKQTIYIFFPLGAARAWSSNLCAAKFPYYNSDPVKRVLQIRDVNGAQTPV